MLETVSYETPSSTLIRIHHSRSLYQISAHFSRRDKSHLVSFNPVNLNSFRSIHQISTRFVQMYSTLIFFWNTRSKVLGLYITRINGTSCEFHWLSEHPIYIAWLFGETFENHSLCKVSWLIIYWVSFFLDQKTVSLDFIYPNEFLVSKDPRCWARFIETANCYRNQVGTSWKCKLGTKVFILAEDEIFWIQGASKANVSHIRFVGRPSMQEKNLTTKLMQNGREDGNTSSLLDVEISSSKCSMQKRFTCRANSKRGWKY